MRNGRFESLFAVRDLAPLVMAATGVVQIVEGLVFGREGLALALGAFVPATVGTTTVAWWLGRREWGRAFIALLGWFAAHAAIGWIVGDRLENRNLLAVCALASSGVTLALASPAFIVTALFARRRDLDAGDALLALLGVWFFLVELAEVLYLEQPLPAVPGLALGVAASMIGLKRCVERRRVCRDVTSGREELCRARAPRCGEDLSALPHLLLEPEGTLMVVEVAAPSGHPEGAYRTADIARPVALLRVRGVSPAR